MKFKKWKFIVKEYFTYTRRERNGIFILASVLVILQGSLLALHYFPDPTPFQLDSATLADVQKMIDQHPLKLKKEYVNQFKKDSFQKRFTPTKKEELFYFDPNHLSIEDWKKLGLSEKQAMVIQHWEERGGRFRDKDDLKKMTVINPFIFTKIEPWIRIDEEQFGNDSQPNNEKPFKKTGFPKKPIISVELNAADSNQLLQLPLIGESRARAIIRYRNYLGGFINVDQLKEIKMLPDSVLKAISTHISIDKSLVRPLNINTVKPDSLRHPYISKALGKMIINYRNEHGFYKSVDDLRSLPLVDDEILSKLAPYLKFNP